MLGTKHSARCDGSHYYRKLKEEVRVEGASQVEDDGDEASITQVTNLVKKVGCCGSSNETQAGPRMETIPKARSICPRHSATVCRAQNGAKHSKYEVPGPNA